MKDLIQVKERIFTKEKINSVNARDLWKFLESKQDFSNWIKGRIKKYEFAKNVDFIGFNKFIETDKNITGTQLVIRRG